LAIEFGRERGGRNGDDAAGRDRAEAWWRTPVAVVIGILEAGEIYPSIRCRSVESGQSLSMLGRVRCDTSSLR
jgi:hypothetical protein